MSGHEGGGPGGLDAAGAAAAVRAGMTSPEALLADARRRAGAWEPWLGALVAPVDRPGTAAGALAGVVTGVKELMNVTGVPRTCGAPEFLGHPGLAEADAAAVARVTESGASLLATVSSHALAYGIITPQTRNPRAPDRVAGGSSGGAAAALAAGFAHLGLGTDTGGSVRIPAACCGVVGLKTTRGVVPLTGVADLAWSLDTVGPLAASVADAALALGVLAGHDPADPESVDAALLPPLDRPRVGVPRELDDMPVDADVRAVWRTALDDLAAEGAELVPVDLPQLPKAHVENGYVIAAEAAAIHGERFAEHGHLLPESTRVRLGRGVELLASRAARARRFGTLLRADLRRLFAETVDLLCMPTLPCRTPPVDTDPIVVEGVEEPVVGAMTRLTGPWNLTGVPAGTVPAGSDAGGAPIGVQVVGPWFGEQRVLAALAVIERRRGGPRPPAAPPAGR